MQHQLYQLGTYQNAYPSDFFYNANAVPSNFPFSNLLQKKVELKHSNDPQDPQFDTRAKVEKCQHSMKKEEVNDHYPVDVDVNIVQEYVCPDCDLKFPFPESDPKTQFNTNFFCHVLFHHLRSEVLTEIGQDEPEVCPVGECQYNIVQFKEDGVPDAESFLIKHYISKHMELLNHLIGKYPKYSESSCLQALQTDRPNATSTNRSKGIPNIKLKPIFLDKFLKFAKDSSSCTGLTNTDPMHVVMFLTEWTSQRNYTIDGVNVLVQWISELLENKILLYHPRVKQFLKDVKVKDKERVSNIEKQPGSIR